MTTGLPSESVIVRSMSLGAGETTLMKMTTAYSMLANGGKRITPTMIDRIQNRYGKTISRHDKRSCKGCLAGYKCPKKVEVWDQLPKSPIGKILRKSHLDELPQFFIILKGDMSIVGPRPERAYFVDKFSTEIPYYRIRHRVRSGITGLAQANGFRGNTSIRKRVENDLYYLENWSLWLDLKIILLTFFNPAAWKNAI